MCINMRTKNTFAIYFHIRNERCTNGKAKIYARITVNGKRIEISTKQLIEIENWDAVRCCLKGKDGQAKAVNMYLERYRGILVDHYNELTLSKKPFSIDTLKNRINGIEEAEHCLINLFDYHNEEMKHTLEWGTLKNYFTTRTYFHLYLKDIYHVKDIPLSQLNYRFLTGFEKYMKERTSLDPKNPCGQNTIMKHIERMRKVVNLAIKNEWLDKDPFVKFQASFIRKDREFLTASELETIETKTLSFRNLQYVKDIFVFSCYTGLAYIDAYNLTPNNISRGIDGEYWIVTSRKKTDQSVRIPILPKAMEIIEKYKSNPIAVEKGKVLPMLSNQKTNSYLKEIADLCGITKPLTFHIARHTFATTVTLTNGVPIETVSKLLGHSSIKTTQIYAKVVESKVSNDMKMLRNRLEDQKNITSKVGM